MSQPPAVDEFASQLKALGMATDLFVAGSLATGDYRPGVSDVDLVALVDKPLDDARLAALQSLHRAFDAGPGEGLALGCAYVEQVRLSDLSRRHPTWTHGVLVHRVVSGITRAELSRSGHALFGRPPSEVLPPMGPAELREAVRSELDGYWTWALRRPWLFLDPGTAELALTSMARARHTLATGELVTKSRALAEMGGPGWLCDQLSRQRRGERVRPRRLRTAWLAWRDARRTVSGCGP